MEFNDQNFEAEVLKSDQAVLVDFFATWCGPCRMQGPIVEEVEQALAGKVKVGKLDVDVSPEISSKYQVSSIPTIIIFKAGAEVKRLVGLQSKESLLNILAEYHA